MNDIPDESGRASGFARPALVAAVLWIAAGALFKLLAGSPNDLPPIVRETISMDLGLKFRLAIGIELAIVVLALLRPNIGWWLVLAQLLVFDLVLALSLDQESCGCFGSDVPMSPQLMLGIDTVFLAALLAGRPWRGFRGFKLPTSASIVIAAAAMSLPWIHNREIEFKADGEPQLTATEDNLYVTFTLDQWEGMLVHDTPLAKFVDPNTLPDTGAYIFWRWTCDHCAQHLEELAQREVGERMLALIRLEEPGDTEANRAVFTKPTGGFVVEVTLPPTIQYGITTPGELLVEGYTIIKGEEGVSFD